MYRGPIKKSTLHYHVKFFSKNEIFESIYKELLEKYYKVRKYQKLKYQSIDSTFVSNKHGIENVGRNKYYKNKRGTKISAIVDSLGIPISLEIDSGNVNDLTFINKHFNNLFITPNTSNIKNNKYKQYLLGDKGYDSKDFRTKLQTLGYKPIIDYNNRNTKNPLLKKQLTKQEKVIYKKRMIVENTFSWLKMNKRLLFRVDKFTYIFNNFIFAALVKMIFNK